MKISYRTNPVIEMAEKGKLNFQFFDDDIKEITELTKVGRLDFIWEKYSKMFCSDIKIMTEPFLNAMFLARNKLLTADKILNVPSGCGMFIFRKSTVCYAINYNNGNIDESAYFVMLIFHEDTLAYLCHIPDDNKMKTVKWITSKQPNKTVLDPEFMFMDDLQQNLYLHLNFLKYAPIEVKFLGPNKRLKDVNCKYANDTKSNIQIIDSTWFTTLVQSEGFKVRGHFRLQPCGEGLKDRKLIWINEFEKEGYTRHFKRPVTLEEFES